MKSRKIQIYILAFDAGGGETSVHWFYSLKEVRIWLAAEVIENDNDDHEKALDCLENGQEDEFFRILERYSDSRAVSWNCQFAEIDLDLATKIITSKEA